MQSIINTLWTMPAHWRLYVGASVVFITIATAGGGLVGGGIVLGFSLLIAAFVKGT